MIRSIVCNGFIGLSLTLLRMQQRFQHIYLALQLIDATNLLRNQQIT
ncbi:hypothetical protein BISA_1120 [Bifidobacterium saguini DSM 23967]|uniref:Uncharacterized protein n=1 Tax=Bifidobacterium saguini DSM 23967 TaxID=1437607 RepID=A0A087D8I2_9BIFI|nr:hypothetical protein BISA_1120 [Bifidobacterium saguini DSM 23967]